MINNQSNNIPEILKPFIRHLWVFNACNSDKVTMTFSAYADGCPGLIFHQSDNGLHFNGAEKKLSPLFLYGQTIQPAKLNAHGCKSMIILNFHPHTMHPVFRFSAHELTDGCLEMNQLPFAQESHVTEQLLNAPGTEAQVEILFTYLKGLIQRYHAVPDKGMQYATAQIMQSGTANALKSVQQSLHVTERTFERKFAKHVGISPRLLSRISQFQSTVTQIKDGKFSKLSDVAYANGYADQSHFNRDFRKFTGLTPSEFMLDSGSHAEAFPAMMG